MQWFLQRFPMEMSAEDRAVLALEARGHRDAIATMELMLQPDWRPREFSTVMALPPRDYQSRGVAVYHVSKGMILGDQLGLGKTVTAIATFASGLLPALVVCPTHLARQWENFLRKFLPSARAHIVKGTKPYALPSVEVIIITYSKLAGWGEALSGRAGRFRNVIFDEVQDLRRDESDKYKAAAAIRDGCDYALGLSATPIYNYGGEIFNVLEIVAPGRIGAREEFYREWCSSRGNGRYLINDPVTFGEYLRSEFLMLRRRREDVGLELPKEQRELVEVPHDPKVLEKIEGDATELARLVLTGSFQESGQAARELDAKMRLATGVSKAPFVADFVRMLVDNGEKVLLFGWHREVYDVWLARLGDFKHGNLQPVLYTGSETPAQKEESLRKFLLPPEHPAAAKVMMMSLRSGSGVDGLQAVCSTCVFGELDWSPGVHEQCIGRLNRDGLAGGVVSYFLVSNSGSDPVVSAVLNLKSAQAVGVVDPDKATDIGNLQVDTKRVKELAADWLRRRGVRAVQEEMQEALA